MVWFDWQAAEQVGYPVMVKASEGGGGKGIRKVNSADDFPNLFRQVRGQLHHNPALPHFTHPLVNLGVQNTLCKSNRVSFQLLILFFCVLISHRFKQRFQALPSSSCVWPNMHATWKCRSWLISMVTPSLCSAVTALFSADTKRSLRKLLRLSPPLMSLRIWRRYWIVLRAWIFNRSPMLMFLFVYVCFSVL